MADSNITKKALADAMKSLMAEEPFSKISISDICARCSMNRQSFYYHFRDKYDLVNWIFYTELIEHLYEHEPTSGWDLLLDVCTYFYANRPFYVNALQVTGQNSFTDYFADVMRAIVQPYFEEIFNGSHENKEELDFYVQLFTDACKTVICRWLFDLPNMKPEKFVALVRHAVVCTAHCVVQDEKASQDTSKENK
ncbi:dihydroxyacetone kinase transcriptional activator DhaS [Caproicibacterium lactatifermentans]|mgnify:FL=1|jgi:probable dihydroxyacetone kinase regulator|uniref:Dihydroxyacetone kinase transcriptional activator DhaS n=1 Tax=Caproicibacterium lactatifermentans TaxID=2666138 RepID=A0A859DQ13_9FIRM|nr:dihydroxyacetone kinase transcriptional activator DhaS [Caproicibacterium lactatifermentans]QKN23900.1 dihydroxyacetone kinase transcriptional activator DhaS [Caproicibacterium lactatifermentans]